MRRIALALTLTCPVAAQFASPPGAVAGTDAGTSSVSFTQPFSPLAAGNRFQYLLGDITAGAQTITALRLQSDSRPDSVARTVNILVQLGHASPGTACAPSTTFASNYAAAPTVVLDDGNGAAVQVSLPATPNGFDPVPIPFNSSASFAYNGSDELVIDFTTDTASQASPYSLDVEPGNCAVTVGRFAYNGLVGCTPLGGRQDIFGQTPTTSGTDTTCSQWMTRGPVNSVGILAIGLTDPNTDFGGLLCAPLRASLDISTFFVRTDAAGNVGNSSSPSRVTFPDAPEAFTYYTQYVIIDPNPVPPRLAVSLSDGIRWDIWPPRRQPRTMIYNTASGTAVTGVSSQAFPPVVFFN